MPSVGKPFDFDINIHGAQVYAAVEPLHPRCLSDGEVDAHIGLLKANLDAVSQQMKTAIRKQAARPLEFR